MHIFIKISKFIVTCLTKDLTIAIRHNLLRTPKPLKETEKGYFIFEIAFFENFSL